MRLHRTGFIQIKILQWRKNLPTYLRTFESFIHTRHLLNVKLQKRPIRSPCLWELTAQLVFPELSQSGAVPLRFIDKFQLWLESFNRSRNFTWKSTHVFVRISNAIRKIFTTNFSNEKWRDKRNPRLVHRTFRLSCGFRDDEISGIYSLCHIVGIELPNRFWLNFILDVMAQICNYLKFHSVRRARYYVLTAGPKTEEFKIPSQ
jgi:hypothetical protein